MPELPEVETIKLGLQKYLVGHTIEGVDIKTPWMVIGETKDIIGAEVKDVRRFGKGLVIDLSNNFSIAIHIKMTGQLIYIGPEIPKGTKVSEKVGGALPNAHTHVTFRLKSQDPSSKSQEVSTLYYNDIRRFGWIKIVKTSDVSSLPFFKTLGPEPPITTGQYQTLTLASFAEILKKKKGPIKPLLMDQTLIGGIGNIYANDSLFLAKIHPKRPANSLTDEEIKRLFEAIQEVMKKGLEVGGASEWQYVNALGESGNYQNFFKVYGKVGKTCVVCGTKIQKITMGGRGTFFCPECQT